MSETSEQPECRSKPLGYVVVVHGPDWAEIAVEGALFRTLEDAEKGLEYARSLDMPYHGEPGLYTIEPVGYFAKG